MNWHHRYLRQATWTRALRTYVFERSGYCSARRVLEVGCGTGAVLADLPAATALVYGLDLNREAIGQCREHAKNALLTCGDAISLPYADGSFDIIFCHFLLLWVPDALRALKEMKRVTAPSGHIIAFAEPDYGKRVDQPAEVAWLGQRQNEALQRQGAALRRGTELATLFRAAGISIREASSLRQSDRSGLSPEDWDSEWQALQADLEDDVPVGDLERLREIDRKAMLDGQRVLSVPTYFVWGQV